MKIKKSIVIIILITIPILNTFSFYKINSLTNNDQIYTNFKKDIEYTTKYINFRRQYTEDNLHLLNKLPKLKLAIYIVKTEDTIFSIAEKTGLSVDTLISVNSFGGEFFLKRGDKIIIPNMKGVIFRFPRRIKLSEIARLYGISTFILKRLNNIHRNELYENEELFIPSGRLTITELDVFLQRRFRLPLRGRLTSRYGKRICPFTRRWSFHPGIDIHNRVGTPIRATAKGRITFVGRKGGYGILVIIEHNNGYTSYYGHLKRKSAKVRVGQIVRAGQAIAAVGLTGRTTGPHLHFEIRRYGIIKNPLRVMKLSSISSLY